MNYNGIPDEYIIYGTLFALCNKIQAMGDGQFGYITMKQHFLLICLSVFEEAPSLKETADFMGCSYQNVKRMAAVLEKKGYLQLLHDKHDRRRQNLVLTEKVTEWKQDKEEITREFMEQLYKGLQADDIKITMQTLVKMNQNIREEE